MDVYFWEPTLFSPYLRLESRTTFFEASCGSSLAGRSVRVGDLGIASAEPRFFVLGVGLLVAPVLVVGLKLTLNFEIIFLP